MYKTFIIFMGVVLMTMSSAQSQETQTAKQDKPVFFANLKDVDVNSPALDRFPKTVRQGIEYLQKNDLAALPMGITEIDGKNLYINKMEYETKTAEGIILESHRDYIDIQTMVKGEEYTSTVRLTDKTPVSKPYDAKIEATFYPASVMPFWATGEKTPNKFVLAAGQFVIYTPNDIHAGGVYTKKPEKIVKIVVKCKCN